jgi:3-methyladenine DNA glycosylase/8-oxoguanine DNA glycosylase
VPSESAVRRWTPTWPVDLVTTLSVLQHGRHDPTVQVRAGQVWRTTRTPGGVATVHYARSGADVLVRAWGPGAGHALEEVPRLLGADDDPSGFAHDAHPVMAEAHAEHGAGWRVVRTGRVMESLVPAVLEQRVTGREASSAWSHLVRRHGQPAPGPVGPTDRSAAAGVPALVVAPDPRGWAGIPSWAWHRAGVDPGRAATIVAAASRGGSVEALSERPAAEASHALRALPGIGAWTAAEVGVRAWGDPDAVSFGDFHLARVVVHALTGRTDGTDEQMAELLVPWAGQRARAVRLLVLHGGHRLPRRGPRATITDHRGW